jgi:hypothetical protein
MASLLLFACGCSTAPVADFLDWVSPSPVRQQGVNPTPVAVPAGPPITSAPVIPTPPPDAPPSGTAFKPPEPLPAGIDRPPMPPLPDLNSEIPGGKQ